MKQRNYRSRSHLRRSLHIEILEDRCVPATFTVTNTNDDLSPGSLRSAITAANTSPGFDNILFNIPGTGPHIIHVQNELPAITDPVSIDGYSQQGSSENTLAVGNNAILQIEIGGEQAPGGTNGLILG